jgi:hypothetical protein
LRHPQGVMTCETTCLFTEYRAHSVLMGNGKTVSFLSSDPPEPTSPPSKTSTQLLLGRGAMIRVSASCWQWAVGGWIGVVVLVSGVDPCSLQRPPIELDGGLMHRGEYSLTKSWNLIYWTCWDMNLERAFIIQGPNRNVSRSIKRGSEVMSKEPSSRCCSKRTTNWLAYCCEGLVVSLKANTSWLWGCRGM